MGRGSPTGDPGLGSRETEATYAGLAAALEHRATIDPHREVLAFLAEGGAPERLTAGQLFDGAARCGAWYQAEGLRSGDLVLLLLGHRIELPVAFFGAIHAGLIPAILPPPVSYSAARITALRDQIRTAGARAIVAPAPGPENATGALEHPGCSVLALDLRTLPDTAALAHHARPSDPAYVQFSSGSTEAPRGVVLSHTAVLHHLDALAAALGLGDTVVSVGWLPLFHDMGLVMQLLLPVLRGGKGVLLPAGQWLRRPELLFRAISEHQGTLTCMPNFGFEHCLRHVTDAQLEGVDLTALKTLISGAEPVRLSTLQRFHDRFAPYGLAAGAMTAGYGMAECVVGASCTPATEEPRHEWVEGAGLEPGSNVLPVRVGTEGATAVVSCGRALPGTVVRIASPEGEVFQERRVGEIEVTGPALFSGYWRDPVRSAEVMREGWFRTGDLGYVADGELYVCGRLTDLIISAGRNVMPEAVEEVTLTAADGALKRALAFGVDQPGLGTETIVLVAEPRRRLNPVAEATLTTSIRSRLREVLDVTLSDVRFVPRGWIPLTTSGKVRRRLGREKYRELPSPNLPAATVAEAVTRRLGLALGGRLFELEDNVFGLGLESLDFLELILELESMFGCTIPLEQFAADPTATRLISLIDEARGAAATSPAEVRPVSRGLARPRSRARRWVESAPPFSLPYGLGNAVLRAAVGSDLVRGRLLEGFARGVDAALTELKPDADSAELLRLNLFCNLWRDWRTGHLRNDMHRALLTVRGAEVFDRIRATGKGVIVAVGRCAQRGATAALVPLLPPPVTVIGFPSRLERGALAGDGSTVSAPGRQAGDRQARLAVQLVDSQRVLRRAGSVMVIGDGNEGRRQFEQRFLGRRRQFAIGYAEVAVATGVPVVPVWASLGWDGAVTIDCGPDLAPDEPPVIVRTYAAWLADRWRSDPGNLPWPVLREFLALRPVEPTSETPIL